jgi:orotate phosphoribosyltransferase
MTNEQVIAEKLLQVQAVKLQPNEPFTWTSGWKSPIYCDNRKVLGFPFIRDFVKSEMCNVIFETFANAEIIAGVATAGIPWGAMAADQLKLPYCYIRSKPKEHGLGNQIEGYFEKGMKVVVVEDLISTGKSSIEAIDASITAGLEVIGCVSVFNYQFEIAANAFAEKNVEVKSLSNYDALLQVGIKQGIIKEESLPVLSAWRQSPQTWQGL